MELRFISSPALPCHPPAESNVHCFDWIIENSRPAQVASKSESTWEKVPELIEEDRRCGNEFVV
jgi:hypothetical protein